MHIIDTHCHYNLEPLLHDWQQHWQTANAAGITHTIIPGVDAESSAQAAQIASASSRIGYALGIHPTTTASLPTISIAFLEALWSKLSIIKVPQAVGETGLDYFRLSSREVEKNQEIELQKLSLIAHIQLANTHQVPIIFHIRDKGTKAHTDLLELLHTYPVTVPFILHCVSGPATYVKECLKLGAYVSFAGNSTYPSAQSIRDLVKIIPPNRLLLETDAPYLPPQSNRGNVCEPTWITETATYLAELGVDIEQSSSNAYKLFRFTEE